MRPATRRRVKEAALGYLFVLPSLLIFGVFVFYPLVRNVYLGFFRSPPFPGLPSTYVGFDQYRDVLTSTDFWDSVKTTFLFALYTVIAAISALRTALYPYLPFSSARLHGFLGDTGNIEAHGWRFAPPAPGQQLGAVEPLFRKLEPTIVEEEEARLPR